jgi:DNA repair protein RecN (Recombination protein N)
MLCQLAIQDIVLIDRLTLSLGRGLTALTGETGAGKSILLDSLGLAVGGKADKSLVRQGAEKGSVAATFDVPEGHEAWALLEEGGLPTEDDTITLRRVQMSDGKSRAFINDQACSVGLLRAVGETLIEIHGQHQTLGFLNAAAHRGLLDQYAALTSDADRTAAAWRDLRELEKRLEAQMSAREQANREADYLRFVADELGQLAPLQHEEHELGEKRAVLMAAEKVSADLRAALNVLEEDGPARRLSTAAGQIERAAGRLGDEQAAPLKEAVTRLDAALSEFAEAREAVMAAAEAFVQDPDELERTEERLFALRAAGRKYSRDANSLSRYLEEVREQLDTLDQGESAFGALQADLVAARKTYERLAAELSVRRQRAAKRLGAAVKGELAPLKLAHATFSVDVDPRPDEPGPFGFDHIAFLVSTNPGAPLGPLASIASGGELSRFVLALKAVLAAKEARTVIIFDEVDSGVGGAVADAVGERLARIAAGSQVLVVTHSPQVAARGDLHWKVEKTGSRKSATSVRALDEAGRIEELARMLAGAEITEEARAAARSLLTRRSGSGRSAA